MSDIFDDFDIPAGEVAVDSHISVPNLKPTIPFNKLAIIGEAPGRDETLTGKPFVGASGRFLNALLAKNSILRDACFIGNVCQVQPPANDLTKFEWEGVEIQGGISALHEDILTLSPTVIVLLGNAALHLAKEGNTPPPVRKKKNGQGATFAWPNSISDWRGTVFNSEFFGCKCIASYHPAACLRNYSWTPLLIFDMARGVRETKRTELVLPVRNLNIYHSAMEIVDHLYEIKANRSAIAIDIEGGIDSMSCISFATSPANGFIVPLAMLNGASYWDNEDDEVAIWQAMVAVLTDPNVPKILQNSLYDRFVLQYSYNTVIRGVVDDTMLKHWEWNCELEKSLGFMCSVHTEEPFYKHEGKSGDRDTFYLYCCKDSATTFEINTKLTPCLSGAGRQHYKLNLDLLNPLLYLQQRGIRYNSELAKQRVVELSNHVFPAQYALDQQARKDGFDVGFSAELTKAQLLDCVYQITGYKADKLKPKSEYVSLGYWEIIKRLKSDEPLTDELRGRVDVLCKRSLNIKSPVFKQYLYDTLKLPVQLNPTTKKPTVDHVALLRLTKKSDHSALTAGIAISGLRTRLQTLAIKPCPDGRMRWSTNIVGSETGRITTSKSSIPVGDGRSGANMQGIPDDWDMEDESDPLSTGMRDLLQADPGFYLAKCDLKGADGWTVGAYLAKLGDPSMLDDLRFGLKPAQIVCYTLRHGRSSLAGKTRPEIKEQLKEVKKEDWDYFACKGLIWGACYTMGPRKSAERVFIESEGKINLTESQARDIQEAIFARYRIRELHRYFQRLINNGGYPFQLTSTVGHTRKFWGRKTEILGEVLAHLPQEYTTHATKLAAYKLWTDPENRLASGYPPLRIEILHQVHDELVLHFRQEDLQWALAKIKWAFDHELIIADQRIKIPFDGAYGTDWAMNEQSKVGSI